MNFWLEITERLWYNKNIYKGYNAARVVGVTEHREPRGGASAESAPGEVRLQARR